MGGGSWTTQDFCTYSTSVGRSVSTDGVLKGNYSAQDMFTQRDITKELKPYNVIRECVDSAEHPNTKPVILALDVTGSMGRAAVNVAKQLNVVMTELYNKVNDIEFMIMGIGDFAYDYAPLQVSQFESDIRIAEQLDKISFEGGGGGNGYYTNGGATSWVNTFGGAADVTISGGTVKAISGTGCAIGGGNGYESYSAAWYFGLNNTKLDCWNRGEKGIIITMGDEPLNPYLPRTKFNTIVGSNAEKDIETDQLYAEASKKFDIYHLNVVHGTSGRFTEDIHKTFGKYLDSKHLRDTSVDNVTNDIVDIIVNAYNANTNTIVNEVTVTSDGISW